MTIIFVPFISLLLFSANAFPHGEDKPGPHGGFIRMPGAFHTELVPDGPNKVKVYLLDVNWKNPSITGSSLKLRYGVKGEFAKCAAGNGLFYICEFSKKIDLSKKGKLVLHSQREEQKGTKVDYELPLRLEPLSDGHADKH